MRVLKPGLIVAVILSLSACSSTPSTSPTGQAPEACLKHCPDLPVPKDQSDRETRFWEYAAVDTFGECRRLHAECVRWHTKER